MGAYFEFLRIDDLGFDFVHSCVPDRHLFGINERQRRVAVRNMHCVSVPNLTLYLYLYMCLYQ